MTLKQFIKICEKYNLIRWDDYMKKYHPNCSIIISKDDLEKTPDYGIIQKIDNKILYNTICGYRTKKSVQGFIYKKNSMIFYKEKISTIYCKEAEKMIKSPEYRQKIKELEIKKSNIKKDFE